MSKPLILAMAGLLATCSSVLANDWPQWLGPDRNCRTSETVGVWTGDLPVVWRQKVGQAQCCPAIAEGRVFVHGAASGKDAEEVVAFDAATGEQLWRDEYTRKAYRNQQGAGPRATPSVVAGRLYTTGITGTITCYDAATGKRHWQVNPWEALSVNVPRFGVCSSPAVTESRVIVPVGSKGSAIIALDAQTGAIAWQKFDEPAAASSPVLITRSVGGGPRPEVIVQTTLRVLGLNPEDGSIYWEHPLVFQPSGIAPTPLATSDLVVVSTQDHGTTTFKAVSDDGAPRQVWWKQDLSSYFSTGSLNLARNEVYLLTNQIQPIPRADLVAVDLTTGETRWTRKAIGYFHAGLIFTGDNRLLILEDTGNLLLAEPTADKFVELAKSKACKGTMINPALSNGIVYVRDDEEVVALKLPPAERTKEAGSQ